MEDRVEESITENREVEHEFGIVGLDGRDNFFWKLRQSPFSQNKDVLAWSNNCF